MVDESQENIFLQADENILREIIREAESYLSAQLQSAIAADQRALSVAGVLGTVTIGLAGAGTALLIRVEPITVLGWLALVLSLLLVLSMFLALLAAMPASFEYGGNAPGQWAEDVKKHQPIKDSLAEMADHYDKMIAKNDRQMRLNNTKLALAVWLSGGSVAAGAVTLSVYLLFSAQTTVA